MLEHYLFRTILIGCGVVRGDWQKDHNNNKKKLYIIEPVVESLLQVIFFSEFPIISSSSSTLEEPVWVSEEPKRHNAK